VDLSETVVTPDRTTGSIAVTQRDVVRFLFKWWRSIVAVFVMVVAVVSLLSYFAPQSYKARSQILIDSIQALATQHNAMQGIDMDVALNTEMQILMSRPVIEATVIDLGLHLIPPKETGVSGFVRSVWRTLAELGLVTLVDEKENWIGSLMEKVRVKALPRSSVLEIEYKYTNAELAAKIVNALTDNFVQHHVDVYTANELSEFYADQVHGAEEQLAVLTRELKKLRESHGSSASTEAKLAMMQTISSLKSQESTVLTDLIDLKSQYDASNEKVVSAQAKLSMIDARIDEATKEILDLDTRGDQIAELESKITKQRETYERFLQLLEDATLTNQATSGASNVRVIEYASEPSRPDKDRLFYISISFVAGLLLSIAIAFLREYFDQRVERIDIAESILGRPVYGAIPVYKETLDFTAS